MDTFLSRFSWGFTKRYRITLLLWVVLLVFGLLSYTTYLNREGFPAVNVPYAVVQGTYLNDDPTVVDQEVITPITNQLNDITEVTTYQATAGQSFFSLVIEFDDNTTSTEGAALVQQRLNYATNIPSSASYEISTIDASKFLNQSTCCLQSTTTQAPLTSS